MDPRAIRNTISVNFEDGIIAMINEATLLEQNDFYLSKYFVCWSCTKSSIDIDDSIVSHFCTRPSHFKENRTALKNVTIKTNYSQFAFLRQDGISASFKFLLL